MTAETAPERPRKTALTLVSGTVCADPPRGMQKRRRFRLTSARGCRREVASLYAEARDGTMPIEVAVKLTYIVSSLVKILSDCELEQRVTALEQLAKEKGTP